MGERTQEVGLKGSHSLGFQSILDGIYVNYALRRFPSANLEALGSFFSDARLKATEDNIASTGERPQG